MPDPTPTVGSIAGKYRLLERLGGGGFGSVWRACDVQFPERVVAVKLLRLEGVNEANRALYRNTLEREIRRLGALGPHPNLVTIHDHLLDHDPPALVYEYLYGQSLRQRLENGAMEPHHVAWVLGSLLKALDWIHRDRGDGAGPVLHRDIKPDNVFLCERPEVTVKVLDFGIAGVGGAKTGTVTRLAVGTPPYQAMEHLKGQATPASDVYAAGVLAWEMLVGRMAAPGINTADVVCWLLAGGPRPVREEAPRCPPWLAEVVDRMCRAEEAERPRDGGVARRLFEEAQAAEEARQNSTQRREQALRQAAAVERASQAEKGMAAAEARARQAEAGRNGAEREVARLQGELARLASELRVSEERASQAEKALATAMEGGAGRAAAERRAAQAEKAGVAAEARAQGAAQEVARLQAELAASEAARKAADAARISAEQAAWRQERARVVMAPDAPEPPLEKSKPPPAREPARPHGPALNHATNRPVVTPSPQPLSAAPTPTLVRPTVPVTSGEVRLSCHPESLLRWIPAGRFVMGSSDKDAYDDEKPPHPVRITRPFLMGNTPVTRGLYKYVTGQEQSQFTDCDDGDAWKLPVERVRWLDAVDFCNRLSAREGLRPAYERKGSGVEWLRTSDGFRLPTEAEWEYAARAGQAMRFAGSDTVDPVAWHAGKSGDRTHPVGLKKANAWGLHDMSGNVWEWVWDWYGPYKGETMADPVGQESGSLRVIRGGSWRNIARLCCVAGRGNADPSLRYGYIGFRLVRSLEP